MKLNGFIISKDKRMKILNYYCSLIYILMKYKNITKLEQSLAKPPAPQGKKSMIIEFEVR